MFWLTKPFVVGDLHSWREHCLSLDILAEPCLPVANQEVGILLGLQPRGWWVYLFTLSWAGTSPLWGFEVSQMFLGPRCHCVP